MSGLFVFISFVFFFFQTQCCVLFSGFLCTYLCVGAGLAVTKATEMSLSCWFCSRKQEDSINSGWPPSTNTGAASSSSLRLSLFSPVPLFTQQLSYEMNHTQHTYTHPHTLRAKAIMGSSIGYFLFCFFSKMCQTLFLGFSFFSFLFFTFFFFMIGSDPEIWMRSAVTIKQFIFNCLSTLNITQWIRISCTPPMFYMSYL